MYCLVIFVSLLAGVFGAPAASPEPSPQPNVHTVVWPWPSLWSKNYVMPLAFVTSQDTSRGIPQPVEDTDEVKMAKMLHAFVYENVKAAHERSKRDLSHQTGHQVQTATTKQEEPQQSSKKKRETTLIPASIPWPLPFFQIPLTYTWPPQSFVSSPWGVLV